MQISSREYRAVTDFTSLVSGMPIYIGDTNDIRTCSLIYSSRVINNWPSQGRPTHVKGYIRVSAQQRPYMERFDLFRQSIYGQPRFLFRVTAATEAVFLRHVEILAMLEWNESAPPLARVAAWSLLRETVQSQPTGRATTTVYEAFEAFLVHLSLRELQQFRALLTIDADGPNTTKAA